MVKWQSLLCIVMVGLAGGCLQEITGPIQRFGSTQKDKPEDNIAVYKTLLSKRLLARYNNQPKYAGKVAKVDLTLAKPPRQSLDKKEVQVEYTQVVFDKWGARIPELEKEYYVVTFGRGQPRIARTEPTVTAGMNAQGGYSEVEAVDTGMIGRLRKDGPTPGDQAVPVAPPASKQKSKQSNAASEQGPLSSRQKIDDMLEQNLRAPAMRGPSMAPAAESSLPTVPAAAEEMMPSQPVQGMAPPAQGTPATKVDVPRWTQDQ